MNRFWRSLPTISLVFLWLVLFSALFTVLFEFFVDEPMTGLWEQILSPLYFVMIVLTLLSALSLGLVLAHNYGENNDAQNITLIQRKRVAVALISIFSLFALSLIDDMRETIKGSNLYSTCSLAEALARPSRVDLVCSDKNYGDEVIELPDGIGKLKNLSSLEVGPNLAYISPAIGQLQNLKKLILAGNTNLENLPQTVADLRQLEELNLRDTKVVLTPQILSGLTSLQILALSNEQSLDEEFLLALQKLPLRIVFSGDLTSSGCLKRVKLANALLQIKLIPYTAGCTLDNLAHVKEAATISASASIVTMVTLDNMGLSDFPSEVLKFKNLTYLSLSDNLIKELPLEISTLTSLEILYLDDNKLVSLPSTIAGLSKLEFLYLQGNPLVVNNKIVQEINGWFKNKDTRVYYAPSDMLEGEGV